MLKVVKILTLIKVKIFKKILQIFYIQKQH